MLGVCLLAISRPIDSCAFRVLRRGECCSARPSRLPIGWRHVFPTVEARKTCRKCGLFHRIVNALLRGPVRSYAERFRQQGGPHCGSPGAMPPCIHCNASCAGSAPSRAGCRRRKGEQLFSGFLHCLKVAQSFVKHSRKQLSALTGVPGCLGAPSAGALRRCCRSKLATWQRHLFCLRFPLLPQEEYDLDQKIDTGKLIDSAGAGRSMFSPGWLTQLNQLWGGKSVSCCRTRAF